MSPSLCPRRILRRKPKLKRSNGAVPKAAYLPLAVTNLLSRLRSRTSLAVCKGCAGKDKVQNGRRRGAGRSDRGFVLPCETPGSVCGFYGALFRWLRTAWLIAFACFASRLSSCSVARSGGPLRTNIGVQGPPKLESNVSQVLSTRCLTAGGGGGEWARVVSERYTGGEAEGIRERGPSP